MAEKTYCRECFEQVTGRTTTRLHIVPHAKKSLDKEKRLVAQGERVLTQIEQVRDHRARRIRYLNWLRRLGMCERYCGRCKKCHQYSGRWLPSGQYAWSKCG
eukprot:g9709.t1